jgi:hypothetical protein
VTLIVSASALTAAAAAPFSPSAVASRACTPLEVVVNIQILGDRAYGWRLSSYTAIPANKTTIAVWSMGGPQSAHGIAAYAWANRTQSTFLRGCPAGRAAAQPSGSLRAAVRVRDGWSFGRKYTCIQPGRFVVETRDIQGGKRVTVRVQRTGKLLAVGEIKGAGGWLRGSKSCEDSDR